MSTMPSEVVSKVVRTQMSTAVNLVLVGPPGSGKGTQAVRLAQAMGVPAISTGDILRKAVQDGSPTGRAVKAVMERGELIGDAMVTDIVAARLGQADTRPGCVLDGFPRTVDQAVALESADDGSWTRNGGRTSGAGGRADSTAHHAACVRAVPRQRTARGAAVPLRRKPHLTSGRSRGRRARTPACDQCATRPLVDFYSARRMLHVIDGTLAAHVVTARIRSAIDASLGFELQQTTVCE